MKKNAQLISLTIATSALLGLFAGAAQAATYTTNGAFKFVSEPGLHPPILTTTIHTQTSKLAPGYFFVANSPSAGLIRTGKKQVGQGGPLILDNSLQPVWFKPVPTNVTTGDLKLQTWNGQPALSWWQGRVSRLGVTTAGRLIVVDNHYHQVASLTGRSGWIISEHEAEIVGTDVWVTAYKSVSHGKRRVLDSAAQEYDLTTGKLLKTWDVLKHVKLSQSRSHPPKKPTTPWDAYHINSIQPVGSNEILVSLRNTWAAYMVNTSTGKIVWTLSGKQPGGTFKVPSNARFQWQHDVQLNGNTVTLFDDACCQVNSSGTPVDSHVSARGLILKLDMTHHTASRVSQYTHGSSLFEVAFLGSTEQLPGGNVVVGWGSRPYFSEFNSAGKMLLDALWPGPDESYRALKETWTGSPSSSPSGAVRTVSGKPVAYASWNGATQVAKWNVLAGSDTSHLKRVASKPTQGFETAIRVPHKQNVYEVQALDSGGNVLGTSSAFS